MECAVLCCVVLCSGAMVDICHRYSVLGFITAATRHSVFFQVFCTWKYPEVLDQKRTRSAEQVAAEETGAETETERERQRETDRDRVGDRVGDRRGHKSISHRHHISFYPVSLSLLSLSLSLPVYLCMEQRNFSACGPLRLASPRT